MFTAVLITSIMWIPPFITFPLELGRTPKEKIYVCVLKRFQCFWTCLEMLPLTMLNIHLRHKLAESKNLLCARLTCYQNSLVFYFNDITNTFTYSKEWNKSSYGSDSYLSHTGLLLALMCFILTGFYRSNQIWVMYQVNK